MRGKILPSIVLGLFAFLHNAFALGGPQYVETTSSANDFPIVQTNTAPAALIADTNDFPGVLIAANNLRTDISRVSGVLPAAINNENPGANQIIIGTLGKSEMIDRLVRERKINVSPIKDKWESFLIQVVPQPFPGVEKALVICGSDKRGTIYGIYDLSENIGVSPWYFWTDVPPKHSDELFVKPGKYVQGPPAVKYRGIFINDEAPDLTGWAKEKFGGYNHAFYTNVFELLLRLKANYLWPAMWDNRFGEDDPLNAKLADEYGIVMGTSHVEPMMRALTRNGTAPVTARASGIFKRIPISWTRFGAKASSETRTTKKSLPSPCAGKLIPRCHLLPMSRCSKISWTRNGKSSPTSCKPTSLMSHSSGRSTRKSRNIMKKACACPMT